jgi:hypothetical protein
MVKGFYYHPWWKIEARIHRGSTPFPDMDALEYEAWLSNTMLLEYFKFIVKLQIFIMMIDPLLSYWEV